ncbi:MAG: UPF0182 family protein, partial [Thermodesulfovibrionia bacterium]|nr:UPF0182 family protein [Thermodesulfovibrionia bacterium]
MMKNPRVFLFIFIAAVVIVIITLGVFNLYIDWLFFEETHFLSVFKTILSTKIATGLLFSMAFLAFYMINILAANRIDFPQRNISILENTIYQDRIPQFQKSAKVIVLLGGLFFAVFVGMFGASKWEEILLFKNRLDVAIKDPIFSSDISFYFFTLPLIETLRRFLSLTIFITLIVTLVNYFLR